MDADDGKYHRLRAKMKAPLLPARRIGDAVPKTRWLVSRRHTMGLTYMPSPYLRAISATLRTSHGPKRAVQRTLLNSLPHIIISSHYIYRVQEAVQHRIVRTLQCIY